MTCTFQLDGHNKADLDSSPSCCCEDLSTWPSTYESDVINYKYDVMHTLPGFKICQWSKSNLIADITKRTKPRSSSCQKYWKSSQRNNLAKMEPYFLHFTTDRADYMDLYREQNAVRFQGEDGKALASHSFRFGVNLPDPYQLKPAPFRYIFHSLDDFYPRTHARDKVGRFSYDSRTANASLPCLPTYHTYAANQLFVDMVTLAHNASSYGGGLNHNLPKVKYDYLNMFSPKQSCKGLGGSDQKSTFEITVARRYLEKRLQEYDRVWTANSSASAPSKITYQSSRSQPSNNSNKPYRKMNFTKDYILKLEEMNRDKKEATKFRLANENRLVNRPISNTEREKLANNNSENSLNKLKHIDLTGKAGRGKLRGHTSPKKKIVIDFK